MDVILHIGAHRTGTTSFQDYMHRHAEPLAEAQIGYWGPGRTRRGLFSGIVPRPEVCTGRDLRRRAEGRVQLQLTAARARGLKTLVVSDANMIGTVRENLRTGRLYPGIGERMARFARAFEGQVSTIMISPRSLELYWSSALSYGVARGYAVPDRDKLRTIAQSRRGWRDVITDLGCAVPGVHIRVMPFETFCGRPEVLLARGAGVDAPMDTDRHWLNRAPKLPELRRVLADRGDASNVLPFGMDRWKPFTTEDHAALREVYADDMMWLTAGADGIATLTEDQDRRRAGKTLPPGAQIKGHGDEFEDRQVARPG
ncbi:hypothetical protein KX928_07170 [Roseobacter sp. YSTF-M11]|uniref:Uncharacterized protein n=1 Tax=Roseobacter insulae TaxID=2859783 RepID=A0A9X1K1J1_9RHOB|nr:hypothetical protein [Roseobacter insulae]MBW4707563.1 hypothetical protein [Roseobacter insulae]